MPGSISSSTAVDLSRLAAPDVVEQLDYEVILAEMKADLVARDPAFDRLGEADPAIKVLQVAAYRELLLRQRVNEACRAVMVASATGGDLDQLGALFGVTRLVLVPANPGTGTPAVRESDLDLRTRILLAPESYSVAGPVGAYRFHALSADADVADADAVSPAPGEVVVVVLSRSGDGVPSAEVLQKVERAVNGETVRPLTDKVTVQAVELVPFDTVATLDVFAGPDQNLILDQAAASLEALYDRSRRIGRDVPRSAIIAALHVGGVERVSLQLPASDVAIARTQVCAPASINLSPSVSDE